MTDADDEHPGKVPEVPSREPADGLPRHDRSHVRQAVREASLKQQGTPFMLQVARLVLAPVALVAGRLGADAGALRCIVEAKLTIDLRRGSLMQQASAKKGGGMGMTCAMLAVIGSFVGLALLGVEDPLWAMAIIQAALLYMITAVLLSDYAELVLGSVDDEVIGPLPVDDATLLLARMAHVLVYLTLIVGSLVLPSALTGALTQPSALLWIGSLAVITPLAVALSLLGIVLTFQLTVKLVGPSRARRKLVNVQVAMTAVLMLSGQLPNLLRGSGILDVLRAEEAWWLVVFPPLWFGGLYDAVAGEAGPLTPVLATLAVVVPLAAVFLALRLAKARVSGVERDVAADSVVRPGRLQRLGARLTRTPVERAGYELVFALSRRERGFRMRTLPMLVLPVAMLVPMLRDDVPMNILPLGTYYAVVFIVAMSYQLRFGDQPEAAWIWRALPVERLGEALVGASLALTVGFVVPWCLVMAVVAAALEGPGALLDVGLASVVSLAGCLFLCAHQMSLLPFSTRFVQSQQMSQFVVAMFTMMLAVALGAAHAGLRMLPFGLLIGLSVAVVLLVLGLGSVRRLALRKVMLPKG